MIDLSKYPRSLWEPDNTENNIRCRNCGRDASGHGATEIVARKLGFAANQKDRVCLPPNMTSADDLFTPKSIDLDSERQDPGKQGRDDAYSRPSRRERRKAAV